MMHKSKILGLIIFLFFFGIISVSAKSEGNLEGNHYIEVDEQTKYIKMEVSNNQVLLYQLDSSNASLQEEFIDLILDEYYDDVESYLEPTVYHVNDSSFDPVSCNTKKFKKPVYGDLVAGYDDEDCSVSGFDIFLGNNGSEKLPVIAHLIAGKDALNNSFNSVKSVRFVELKKENSSVSDDDSDERDDEQVSDSKKEENTRTAKTSYCSDDLELLKTFKFIGRILSIVKILIPLVIIVLGAIDFFKAVVASKDDEIKKSMKSLMFRVLAGVIIFFIPTIVNLVFMLIDDWGNYRTDYSVCSTCVTNPSKCKV
ncbi:MAG: hypothetical protein HFI09_04970 [Bacilli bacterium]|nr:hypothetical protein [Bacilli bacterium]